MDEQYINEMLLRARDAANKYDKQGKGELSTTILQCASLVALRALTEHPEWYKGKLKCRHCKSILTYEAEQKYYMKFGYCFNEENVYGDYVVNNLPEITEEVL